MIRDLQLRNTTPCFLSAFSLPWKYRQRNAVFPFDYQHAAKIHTRPNGQPQEDGGWQFSADSGKDLLSCQLYIVQLFKNSQAHLSH